MKIARIFAVIFAIVGLVLMLGTAVVCFGSMDAPVRAEIPETVKVCAREMAEILNAGELDAVSEKLYGNPDLGTEGDLSGEAAAVWGIFCGGISCELVSDCYVSGSSFAVDAVITVPKIESITDSVGSYARVFLDERIAAAEKMDELYDDNNEFRQDVIDEVVSRALGMALAEEPEMLTYETTFGFVYQGNQWYVVPDSNLIRALSGGL